MKDGGLIKTTSESTALAKYQDVSIEGISYRVKVTAVEPVETYEDVSGIAFYRTPKNPDKGKLSMANILQKLFTAVNSSLANVTAEVIGSGLYLYGTAAPTVNFLGGAVNEQMNIIGNTAQDVSRLPAQCKHGYVAQVANSENLDADNYYVKFYADNGTQGSGKWEECVRPHQFQGTGSDQTVIKGFNHATMPHALINNRNGTFTFKITIAKSGSSGHTISGINITDNTDLTPLFDAVNAAYGSTNIRAEINDAKSLVSMIDDTAVSYTHLTLPTSDLV